MPYFLQVGDIHVSGHLHDVKENLICQTKPPPSIVPWFSSDAPALIVDTFGCGHWSPWPSRLLCSYTAPNKANCDVLYFFRYSISSNRNVLCLPLKLSLASQFSFLGPLLVDHNHCRLGTQHKSYSFGIALTQTFRYQNRI